MDTRRIGSRYEQMASAFLLNMGYHILERNYHDRKGEIDLIARHEGYLVFIEVKYRSGTHMGSPADAVDARKQGRIRHTAQYYMYTHHIGEDTPCRFDVVCITGEHIEVIQDAF